MSGVDADRVRRHLEASTGESPTPTRVCMATGTRPTSENKERVAELIDEHGTEAPARSTDDERPVPPDGSPEGEAENVDVRRCEGEGSAETGSVNSDAEKGDADAFARPGADDYAAGDYSDTVTSRGAVEHHNRVAEAVRPLGKLAGNPTGLVAEKEYWYVTDYSAEPWQAPDGSTYPRRRRMRWFDGDYASLVNDFPPFDRTLYALTSYKEPSAQGVWERARYEEGEGGEEGEYVYPESKPSPDPAGVVAVAAWGDIDLRDDEEGEGFGVDLKAQRPTLDAEQYERAEAALQAYADEFATLYGGHDAVYMLDSVGGAYLFGAPEATLPIARHFSDDEEARGRVMQEFIDRTNDWLREAQERVEDRVEGAEETLDPDWANNHNRQYKAPLTIHAEHDAVVSPADSESVTYRQPVPVDAVDDDLLAAAREWCADFTAVEHQDRVDDLVAELWPAEYEEHGGDWKATLEAWAEEDQSVTAGGSIDASANVDTSGVDLADRTRVTAGASPDVVTDYPALMAAYEQLDGRGVADETIAHAWRDTSGDKRMFYPVWDPACNGRANIAGQLGWKDTASGDSGGPAKMALIAAEGFARSADARGRDFFRGVRLLRERFGFDLPIYVPECGTGRQNGDDYEQTPAWALRNAAVAFGLIYRREFEQREADDGSTYAALPDAVYNATLERLAEAGVEHGRSTLGDGRSAKSYLRRKESDGEETDEADETVAEFLSAI